MKASLKSPTAAPETAPKTVTYADAGVDLRSGDHAKERIKYLAQKTFNRNVLGGIGGFGALYRLDMQRWKNPILVSLGRRRRHQAQGGLSTWPAPDRGRRPGQPLRK